MNLPTTFALPPETIDRLRAVAGRLLRESPDYQQLLKDFPPAVRTDARLAGGAPSAASLAGSRWLLRS